MTAISENKNYLPDFTPKSLSHVNTSENFFWKRVWQVALVVSVIAFSALAVSLFLATSSIYPNHLPVFTALFLIAGLPLSNKVVVYLWEKAYSYEEKEFYQIKHKSLMEQNTKEKIFEKLRTLRVTPENALEPSIQSDYCEHLLMKKESEKAEKIYQSVFNQKKHVNLFVDGRLQKTDREALRISKIDFNDPNQKKLFNALQSQQKKALGFLFDAALNKLKAAFFLHRIKSPKDKRIFEDFIRPGFSNNPLQHMTAFACDDPTAQSFSFAEHNNSLTYKEILNLSYPQLLKIFENSKKTFSISNFFDS